MQRQLEAYQEQLSRRPGASLKSAAIPSAAKPLGGGPTASTGMSQLEQGAVKPVNLAPDVQPAQQGADGSNCPDSLGSPASQQHPERVVLHQLSAGPAADSKAKPLSRLFSLLGIATAAGKSEADRQQWQHEVHMQNNISEIYAHNQAVAAQQHALPVGMSSTAKQPVTSQAQREAHIASIIQEEKQMFREKRAALQWLLLEQKRTALVEKLEQHKAYIERLAKLPGHYFGEPHTPPL